MKSGGIEQQTQRCKRATSGLSACALMGFMALAMACGSDSQPAPPVAPTPQPEPATANVYILPGATALGGNAFGDHPVVIRRGERMRLRNADSVEHNIVSDRPSLPDHNVPAAYFWLVALAPLLLLPFLIPALARKDRWYVRVIRALLVLVPLAVAVALAAQHEQLAFEEEW